MIKNIRLENFMAHQATSIELSPGVTVITGPNNIGKSAVVEAIRYLVYNPAPKNVIRHGAKRALVRLELDSGEIITWQRQDKNASYTIEQPGQEPEQYHKFGRDVPDDVRSLLRLELVDTDTGKLDIHLGNQREPIFLLDRPGSHAAGFFAASTEADYLLKMQQLLKSKIEQSKKDSKRLDSELVALERQLDYYKPLDDLEVQINQAEILYTAILETVRQLPLLEEIMSELLLAQAQLQVKEQAAAVLGLLENPPVLEDITGLSSVLAELTDKTEQCCLETDRAAVLINLTSPPALDLTAELESLLGEIWETQTQHTATQAHSRILAPLEPPPVIAEVEKLQDLIQNCNETLINIASLRKHQTVLAPVSEPPPLKETGYLEDLCVELRREQDRCDCLDMAVIVLAELQTPPETLALLDLEETLDALEQAAVELSRQEAQLATLKLQLERQQSEIQAYLQDAGLCPLCGSPLDLAHFLESWHG